MRWENIQAQLYGSLWDTTEVINNQKSLMQSFVNNIPQNLQEEYELRSHLQAQKDLLSMEKVTEDGEILKNFLVKLGEKLDLVITETLDMSQESKDARKGAISTKEYNEIKKSIKKNIDEPFGKSKSTVTWSNFEKILKSIRLVQKNKIGSPEALARLDEIIEMLESWESKSMWQYRDQGAAKGHSMKLSSDIGASINRLLNEASALIKIGDVAGEIGIIGEQAIAAMLASKYITEEKGLKEITSGLLTDLKKGFGSANGLTVKITGEDKSSKGYFSDEKTNFAKTSNSVMIDGKGEFFSFHATDDKVDIEVTIPERSYPLNASVKNYNQTNTVTILSGNIFPILAIYDKFIEHYIALISSVDKNVQGNLNKMYQGVKFTVGIHALVGGVQALATKDSNTNVIKTGVAEYFIVNNNKNKYIEVYSTRKICDQILKDVNYIELLKGDNIKAPETQNIITKNNYNRYAQLDDRFMGIDVQLKLNQLRNSLRSSNENA